MANILENELFMQYVFQTSIDFRLNQYVWRDRTINITFTSYRACGTFSKKIFKANTCRNTENKNRVSQPTWVDQYLEQKQSILVERVLLKITSK
jgi:hypothetical protein